MTGDHQHARREDHWDDLLGDEADVHDDLDVFRSGLDLLLAGVRQQAGLPPAA